MAPTLETLGIAQMSREDRLTLVQAIWDTITTEPAASLLTDAQRAELDRRIAEDDADPGNVVPWNEAKARLKVRLAGISRREAGENSDP